MGGLHLLLLLRFLRFFRRVVGSLDLTRFLPFMTKLSFVWQQTCIAHHAMRYAPPNIFIQSVKRGSARRLANTVLKVEDRTWRGKHQVRTPVHELGDSIAENKGEFKTICQRRIANRMSKPDSSRFPSDKQKRRGLKPTQRICNFLLFALYYSNQLWVALRSIPLGIVCHPPTFVGG